MSAGGGKIQKAGAAYEAALVDNVTGPANAIIKTVDRLKQAFEELRDPAADVNRSMAGIGRAMQQASQQVKRQSLGQIIAGQIQRAGAVISNVGQSIGQSLLHIGNQIRNVGFVATGMAAGIGAAMYSTVRAAGDATETLSAFNAVFRESADEVGRWSQSFAKSIGRSSTQMRQGLVNFRAFFTGLGVGNDEADAMSKRFQSLALDFASFFNITDDEGMRRFLGGLSGQSENLLRFGINVQEAALTNTVYAKSLGKTADQMTQLEKVFARAEIITKTMKEMNALGDAFRTRFSLQNQIKALSAAFRDLKVAIGDLLETQAVAIVSGLTSLFDTLAQVSVGQIRAAIGLFVALGTVGTTLIAAGTAMSLLGPPIIAFTTALGALAPIISAFATNPALAGVAIAGAFTLATANVLNLKRLLESLSFDVLDKLVEILGEIGDTASLAIQGVSSAIKNGDWESAWGIVAQAFKVAMSGAIKEVKLEIQQELKDTFTPPTQQISTLRRLRDFWMDFTLPGRLIQGGGGFLVPQANDPFAPMMAREMEGFWLRINVEAENAEAKIRSVIGNIPNYVEQAINRPAEAVVGAAAGFWSKWTELQAAAQGEFGGQGPTLDEELSDYPLVKDIETIKRQFASVGGFGSQFASMAGNFAPVMNPIERNTERMVEEQKETNTKLETMNRFLDDAEGLLFQ